MRNQTINLNLIPTGVMPVVHLSQYDEDVDGSLIFNIYNGVIPYDLTGCVAHIQGVKPDGTVFDYECTVHDTYVTSATEFQMTTSAGDYEAELRISNNGSVVGTLNFVFSIERSTTAGVDWSKTDIPEIIDQIEAAETRVLNAADSAEDSADDAATSESNSEAWAVGQRDGVDVESTDPTYENNSKYYAGQADDSAEDSEAYAVGKRDGVDVTSGDVAYENNSKYYSVQSEGSAEDSEAYAIGKRNGVDVTSDDPAYENNSKYWSTQANAHIEDAEAWAVGQRDGTDVPSTDPTYHNNSKYYAAQIGTEVKDAEAWAKGTRAGVPVTSGDPTYENNSDYYREQSEAWADGQINGVDVPNTHPAYHNNAKYWSQQSAGQTISGLSDVSLTQLQNGDVLQYDSTSLKWENASTADMVPTMTGATAGTAGTKGVVPAPSAGDEGKYLKGDGTWGTVTTADMTGATAGTAGAHGLVPAPAAGDENKFLRGDGTWAAGGGGGISHFCTIPTFSGNSFTYNGTAQGPTVTWEQDESQYVTITNATATNAGTYTLTITINDTTTTVWSDFTTAPKTYEYTIAKKAVTVPTLSGTYTYNGTAQSVSISAYDANEITVSGDTSATNAGTYTVYFDVASANYIWNDDTVIQKNATWSIAKAAGSATLSANSVTLDTDHLTATVTVTSATGNMSVSSSDTTVATVSPATLTAPGGTLTISSVNNTNGSATVTLTIAASTNYLSTTATIAVSAKFLEIVSFADGTDAQIEAMLNAYYNDEITWAEMGWAVGNTRLIHLDAMTAPSPDNSQTWPEQNITIVIVAHDHSDLATPINGHTKACITVQTREYLNNLQTNLNTYLHIALTDTGSDLSTFTKWSDLYPRTYLRNTVFNSMSTSLKNTIKECINYRHSSSSSMTASEAVTDTLFLPSYPEIYGTASSSGYTATNPTEGTQFEYYTTAANRIKYGNNNGEPNAVGQLAWTSSFAYQASGDIGYMYKAVIANGTADNGRGSFKLAIAPAWVM